MNLRDSEIRVPPYFIVRDCTPSLPCTHFIVRICTPLIVCTILSSEWCIYHARFKKRRRAVLAVLPFVEFWSSGRKCATITIKLFDIYSRHFIHTINSLNRSQSSLEFAEGVDFEVDSTDADMVCGFGGESTHGELQLLGDTVDKV